jgi:3-deoxy-D-manno-octulosonic-acid transferase
MNALDLLYIALAGATAPWWLRKSRSGWSERFGHISPLALARPGSPDPRPRLLLHAVSVGEVSALRTLVPLLLAEGSVHVIISASTDTGLKLAKDLFAGACDVVRYPLDFSWSVRRFLDAVKPDAVALVELELWPSFVRACRAQNVPVCVINGRLSARSFRGYQRFPLRGFFGPVFGSLSFAAVQDETYAARFEAMGVPPGACLITDTMKWDAAKIEDSVPGSDDLARQMGIDRARPLIVAGSTGPGEEALLRDACPAGVQLLCAPRKPERFEDAAAALPGCIRRSKASTRALRAAPPTSELSPRTFLLDTIGELRKAYALADVVVVGRSFGDLYGSDPIEPIALGKPTVIGPAVSDFHSIVAAFEQADGIARATRDGVRQVLADLIADPDRRADLASRGRGCIREHQGASTRHAELLLSLVAPRRPTEPPSAPTMSTTRA